MVEEKRSLKVFILQKESQPKNVVVDIGDLHKRLKEKRKVFTSSMFYKKRNVKIILYRGHLNFMLVQINPF